MKMKECINCKQILPLDSFHKDKTRSDGLSNKCKVCKNQYCAKWRTENRNYPKFWLQKNPNYYNNWRNKNPEYYTNWKIKNPLYLRWNEMHRRCEDKQHNSYRRYGGRGISVCAAWSNYSVFVKDMGLPPTPEHQIDRVDNDGDYNPANCRWATPAQNARNRRCVKMTESLVIYAKELYDKGIRCCEIAKIINIKYNVVWNAINGKTFNDVGKVVSI